MAVAAALLVFAFAMFGLAQESGPGSPIAVSGSVQSAQSAVPHVRSAAGTLVIPKSSQPQTVPAGHYFAAHTNVEMFIPAGLKPEEAPPYSGYAYETPASLACHYGLVTVASGISPNCNPNATTVNPSGGSNTIAIVDAYDDPEAAADLAYFSDQFGLPFSVSQFEVVWANTANSSCPGNYGYGVPVDYTGGWEVEESLDIEWAHAMAPSAKIYLVEACSNYDTDLQQAVLVANNLVQCGSTEINGSTFVVGTCPSGSTGKGEVSMSWGGGEWSGETGTSCTATNLALNDGCFKTPNVVYFASSGDSPGIVWPGTSVNVVSAGGTTVRRNVYSGTFGNFVQETAWVDGGSGISYYEPRPSYQSSISSIVGSYRGVPDMSFDADPNTGVWVYDTFPMDIYDYYSWWIVGGTSLSAPALAGIVNRAGHFAASSNVEDTWIYTYSASTYAGAYFSDITYGYCYNYMGLSAVAGYDSGWCCVPRGLPVEELRQPPANPMAMAGFQAVQAIAMLRIDGRLDLTLQAAILDRLLRLPVAFFRHYTVGDLADRTLGIGAMRQVLTGRTIRGLLAGLFCLFSFALMFYFDVRLALVASALTAVRGAVIVATSAVRLRHERRHFDLQGKVGGLVLQFLTGIGKLRVAAAKVRALEVWARRFAEQKRHFVASQRAANLLNVAELGFPAAASLVIFAAAEADPAGNLLLDTGRFLAFFAAFGQSLAAVGEFSTALAESLIAVPYFTRVRPLLAAPVEISEERKPPGELSGAFELGQVTFRYLEGGPTVLDKVSIRVEKGEYIALVGASGSGKSTIFRLLLGFEKPESGAVFYDGKSLDTLDVSAVRRQIGVVLQNGKLTSGSIFENICGGVQLPIEEAWHAARLAGLDADIEAMPMGMHTIIAEGLSTFSGGQRQRLMIARALVHRPRLLLFDEATSALDNVTQSIVSASLATLNVTRVVIAHRLSTVEHADRIIVLAQGQVVQSGSFAELSAAPGPFADFAKRQLL